MHGANGPASSLQATCSALSFVAKAKSANLLVVGSAGLDGGSILIVMGSRLITDTVPVFVGPPGCRGNGGNGVRISDPSEGDVAITKCPVVSTSSPVVWLRAEPATEPFTSGAAGLDTSTSDTAPAAAADTNTSLPRARTRYAPLIAPLVTEPTTCGLDALDTSTTVSRPGIGLVRHVRIATLRGDVDGESKRPGWGLRGAVEK